MRRDVIRRDQAHREGLDPWVQPFRLSGPLDVAACVGFGPLVPANAPLGSGPTIHALCGLVNS